MSHLKEVNLSYFGHMIRAQSFAFKAFKIMFVLVIHSVLPFVWEEKATTMVNDLQNEMKG